MDYRSRSFVFDMNRKKQYEMASLPFENYPMFFENRLDYALNLKFCTLLAFSTYPGEVAADGPGRNGMFTKHLLQHLPRPGLSLQQILMETRKGVVRETDGKQIPWESYSFMEEVYLAGETEAVMTR
jgi:hypothetical protein